MRYVARWVLLSGAVGLLAGTASALLIVTLDWATATREAHRWLIALLPLSGLVVGLLYHRFGRSVEAGSNLILEEIHAEVDDPARTVPARMTPLILLGTVLTHLCGGSVGREGTAVQTGASLADQLTVLLRRFPGLALTAGFTREDRRVLLMSGIAAGFGSVFGVPLAGAVFGVEILTIGAVRYRALLPCLLASLVGDLTARAWGIRHTADALDAIARATPFTSRTFLLVAGAGVLFGLTARIFVALTHAVESVYRRIGFAPLRSFAGGVLVASLVLTLHAEAYIGLGIRTIEAAFRDPVPRYAFAAKLALTALTVGAGFKGGEVTPLFFIGATLGNALAGAVPLASSLLAALGFVAVFAGAFNTPIASSVMAYELFGPEAGAFAAVACMASYLCSGPRGIYHAQRRRA